MGKASCAYDIAIPFRSRGRGRSKGPREAQLEHLTLIHSTVSRILIVDGRSRRQDAAVGRGQQGQSDQEVLIGRAHHVARSASYVLERASGALLDY